LRLNHYILAALVVLVLAPLAVVHTVLRASLPQLDGNVQSPGLTAPVRIERDRLGVPTIVAANRLDLAYATGFVHGQDRFFEMDLSRRLAAGELAELFGAVAVDQDRKTRLFRFRKVAQVVVQQASPEQRAVVEAYARGVNAGLSSLRSRPWEYWLLGTPPAPWRAEDTALVIYAMWWDLQANGMVREMLRREINARIGGKECDAGWKCGLGFFYPARTQWDAPNTAGAAESAMASGIAPPATGIPGPDVLDVRGATAAPAGPARGAPARGVGASATGPEPHTAVMAPAAVSWNTRPVMTNAPWRVRLLAVLSPVGAALGESHPEVGSNNWAVAGRLTASGSALVASDMHLGQNVPTLWYHARLRTSGSSSEPALDLTGVTLPGAPLLVAGSNGHIAWGFTNSYGDWLNVALVPCTSVGANELQTPAGTVPLSVEREEIRVKGEPPALAEVKSGPSGTLLRAEPERRMCWFGSWLATVPPATNMNLMGLERASSTQEALALAPRIGIPHQNFVVGDRDGHIGWSIYGRIPTDIGAERASGHSPWTTVDDHPRIVDPPLGRIWTANARATDDPRQEEAIGGDLAQLGSEYDLGARARQIRDDLLALKEPAAPADMLRIQLDDRAVFLTRWHDLLLELIDAESVRGHPKRAEFRKLVESWDARADVDSVGYRLVRGFRTVTELGVWQMIARALRIPAGDSPILPSQFEAPLWQLIHDRPLHMLAADYPNWRDFLLAQLDETIADLEKSCGRVSLERCTWGTRKVVRIRHPMSRGLPFLAPFLDMPPVELPGDHDMPRVQDGSFGASERFAVSPGHEDQGYLHLPGGQSGHPLSPYYRAGFLEWAHGQPLPFLPGAVEHTLTLRSD
jgi:penicillin G amidase